MRRVMRWRYYCDFCKKSSGGSLRKHEKHCGANPNRVCRMCKLARQQQQPIAALMDALDVGGLGELKSLSAECPACIVAALRQRRMKDPVSFDHASLDYGYDFKAESKKFFERIDYEEGEREMYA